MQAERPRLAMEVSREMSKYFLVDGHELKLKALTAMSQSTNPATQKAVWQTAVAQVTAALNEDRHDLALQFIALADGGCNQGQDGQEKAGRHCRDKSEVEKAKQEFAAVGFPRSCATTATPKQAWSRASTLASCKATGRPDCRCWPRGATRAGRPRQARLWPYLPIPRKNRPSVKPGSTGEEERGRSEVHLYRRALYWINWPRNALPTDRTRSPCSCGFCRQEPGTGPATRIVPGSFQGRSVENRILLLREGGGTMQSEEAVQRGLDWLAAHQGPSGGWSMDKFPLAGRCTCGDPGMDFDVGATALALLPFLGAGRAPGRGRFKDKKTVFRGLNFLLALQQQEKGNFSDSAYENALATIVMSEVSAINPQAAFRESAAKALAYIVNAQNGEGGWGYVPRQPGADTSVSGWQFPR